MIIIETNIYNGIVKNNIIFYAAPIYNGDYKNKFGISESALNDFPEIFKITPYEIGITEPINFVNTYPDQPLIDQYRLINVNDLYNGTIDIHIFNTITLETETINRPYIDGTWTNDDVIFYINQLDGII